MDGRWRQLCHFGPIAALTVIGATSVATNGAILFTHPISPLYKLDPSPYYYLLLLEYGVFIFLHFGVLVNFFRAAFIGPGFVPLHWHPKNAEHQNYLQHCDVCRGYQPPRAHHCRKCKRCVLKMDHHCPWINICVGQKNQASFIYFVFFCPVACFHALCYLVPVLYRIWYYEWYYYNDYQIYEQLVVMPQWFVPVIFLGAGMAFGITATVGLLFAIQLRQGVRNKTAIEDHIHFVSKSIRRQTEARDLNFPTFELPYDLLSWRRNLREVFTTTYGADDYHLWPLRPSCSMFDLSLEQLRQKKYQKEYLTKRFQVISAYNGSWLPVFAYGWRTACLPLLPDERRLKVGPGDIVNVSKCRGSWVYGELVPLIEDACYQFNGGSNCSSTAVMSSGRCGWFPRRSARMLDGDLDVARVKVE